MRKLLASIHKEFLILIRDIPGLAMLFVMPVFLVIVITLVQEKSLESKKESKVSLLFIDDDNAQLSQAVEKGLIASDFFEIKKSGRGTGLNETEAKELVAKGAEQIAVVIPQNATLKTINNAKKLINSSFLGIKTKDPTTNVIIYFDPNIKESYRNSVTNAIKSLVQGAEIKILFDVYFSVLPLKLNNQIKETLKTELNSQMDLMQKHFREEIKKRMGKFAPYDLDALETKKLNMDENFKINFKTLVFPWRSESIVKVYEVFPSKKEATLRPTFVQNNVPAFALFAMFFIVIPLAGSIITEKNDGTFSRISTLPVSYLTLLSGKIVIYTLVCLMQLLLMILIGIFLFPYFFEIPALRMGNEFGAIFFIAVASAFAAIGFGLLMGTFSSNHGQAAMVGSVMVVILAIIGGIFIPVYLMPDALRKISIFSPIRWGIDSFVDLFVRGGNFKSVLPNALLLFSFFITSMGISLYRYTNRN